MKLKNILNNQISQVFLIFRKLKQKNMFQFQLCVAQHEGAVTPQCIVQKNPQVPHTNRQVACHPMNNARVKRSSIPRGPWPQGLYLTADLGYLVVCAFV